MVSGSVTLVGKKNLNKLEESETSVRVDLLRMTVSGCYSQSVGLLLILIRLATLFGMPLQGQQGRVQI